METRRIYRFILAVTWVALTGPALAADSTAKSGAKTDIERGRYIVAISGCNDCHTPGFMVGGSKIPEKDWLTGNTQGWRGPWGTTYPTNLRLYFQELTEDQWVQLAREIQRRPPMPYYSLNAMSEADVRAMYRYIGSLGPAGKPAPQFIPPDKVPPPPYIQYPDKAN